MKSKYIFISLLIFATALTAAETISFDVNGLKVIFKPNTANDIVAANLYFRGGVKNLTRNQAGIENFALIVAQKATKNFPKDELNSRLERMNSKITSSAGKDYSSLDLLSVKQNFKSTWEIFADMLVNPLFNPEDVDLERQKIISAIEQSKDNPDNYQDELADQLFYAGHPYAIPVDGTVESVSAFTPEDLKSFLKKRMESSQLLLVVVGNTSKEEIESLVKDTIGKLPKGGYKDTSLPAVSHQEPAILIVYRDIPTNYIIGQFPVPGISEPQWYAALLAGAIMRDRMFEEVRTKRGLSYAPAAGVSGRFSSNGFIYVTAVDADSTIKVMINEVKKMQNEPVTEKDLNDKLSQYITRVYMGMETNAAQADRLATFELGGIGYQAADGFIDNLKKVTPADIQKICQENIKNLQFVLIGDPETLTLRNFKY